jgi:serine/threonine protein kinase
VLLFLVAFIASFITIRRLLISQVFELMSEKSRRKCLKEVKLLQTMSHPNIINYVDACIEPASNELVIVLEWAEGGDLKNLIRKVGASNRSFSERQVWKYCLEMARGLHHMHSKRVMHRDLKPANVMLTIDNQIKLGDLGLSRYLTEQTMEAFSKVGTPLYMSPEVLGGKGYGFEADVWSLGCLIYELCTLKSPFKPEQEGANLYQLFKIIKDGAYKPIPDSSPYSRELVGLIKAMLDLEPERRPPMDRIVEICTQRLEAMGSTPQAPRRELPKPPPPAPNLTPTPTQILGESKLNPAGSGGVSVVGSAAHGLTVDGGGKETSESSGAPALGFPLPPKEMQPEGVVSRRPTQRRAEGDAGAGGPGSVVQARGQPLQPHELVELAAVWRRLAAGSESLHSVNWSRLFQAGEQREGSRGLGLEALRRLLRRDARVEASALVLR